jgi:hypothetical protein
MKNLNDSIGNRTRDLPACSAVPQLPAPPRAPTHFKQEIINFTEFFYSTQQESLQAIAKYHSIIRYFSNCL